MAAPAAAAAAKALAKRALINRVTSNSEHGMRRIGCGCAAAAAVLSVAAIALLAGFVATASPLEFATVDLAPRGMASATVPIACPDLAPSQGYGNTPYEHPHTGIDLICPADTPIAAISTGVVHQRRGPGVACLFPSGASGGLGRYAEVDSGDVAYIYGHLDRFALADGTQVVPGTIIGYEGTSGCSTGFHLHFEVRVAGRATNPCPFLPLGYPSVHDAAGDRCWGPAPP
ncbi:MAG: M23 family metallopeptidase [Candidatus Dormibacteria bacterium]